MRRQLLSSATASAHVTSIVAPISSRSLANSVTRPPKPSEDDFSSDTFFVPSRFVPSSPAAAVAHEPGGSGGGGTGPLLPPSRSAMRTRRSAAQLCVARGSERTSTGESATRRPSTTNAKEDASPPDGSTRRL